MLRPFRFGFQFGLRLSLTITLQLCATATFAQQENPDPNLLQRNEAPDKLAIISIIIDDIGHSRHRGERAINLPGNITIAVIPATDHAIRLSTYAHQAGREVMVHLPMENMRDQPMESLALTSSLNRQDFDQVFDQAVKGVPFATGINNHMGSSLTQDPIAMNWLMQSIKRHQLFFVDSRTTPNSIASRVAQKQSIQSASRDIFLDNDLSPASIDQQFRKLIAVAKRNKTAIAIGHPHSATMSYLEQAIPALAAENIIMVPVSEVIKFRLAEKQIAGLATASQHASTIPLAVAAD